MNSFSTWAHSQITSFVIIAARFLVSSFIYEMSKKARCNDNLLLPCLPFVNEQQLPCIEILLTKNSYGIESKMWLERMLLIILCKLPLVHIITTRSAKRGLLCLNVFLQLIIMGVNVYWKRICFITIMTTKLRLVMIEISTFSVLSLFPIPIIFRQMKVIIDRYLWFRIFRKELLYWIRMIVPV